MLVGGHGAASDYGPEVIAGPYVVGDAGIRASHVRQKRCLWSALEPIFGVFEDAPLAVCQQAEAVTATLAPEPLDGMPEEFLT